MFCAAALLFSELPELLAPLTLERADAAPGHDQRLARVDGHSGQVDFPEVNGRLGRSGSLFRLRDFHADVQLKATVPDQSARSGVLRQGDRQDERRSPFAHRQDHPPMLTTHRLGGPVNGIEALISPGVLHAHLGMFPAQFARRLDGAEEGAEDGLHRLAV